MPLVNRVTSQKFLNPFTNGVDFTLNPSDFTENLAGSAMGRIKLGTTFEIYWYDESTDNSKWSLFRVDASNCEIERTSGSFYDAGFYQGQAIRINVGSGIASFAEMTIDEMTATKLVLSLNGGSPHNVVDPTADYGGMIIVPIMSDVSNLLTSLIYGFGIIGNNEVYNKRSKVTEENQEYYFRNLVSGGGAVVGVGKGTSNAFITGDSTCEFDSIDSKTLIYNNNNTSFVFADAVQTFTVTHEFNINPYYLAGELSNLQDLVAPELYKEESLKYAFDVDFRTKLSNPNRSIKATFDNEHGSVGWLNQNFNGFDNEYEVESIAYEDAITADSSEGLILNSSTKATITVGKIDSVLAVGQRAGVYISYLPDAETEYIDTASTQTENFLLDYLYHSEGSPVDVGTGIIKSIDSSIVSDKLVIEVVFDYTVAQRERLTRDSNYLICVEIADSTLSAGDSDRVVVIADVNTYQQGAFIEGLTEFTDFRYLVYGQTFGEGEATIAEAWDEDGILVEGSFDLDLANEAVLQSVQFELVAHNPITSDYFRLDSYIINTGGSLVSAGVQQIEIEQSRNYNNIAFEDFNKVEITTGARVGDIQTYTFLFGQKLTWQDWIANPNVNTLFFDNTKPNNNRNYKASNYSGVSDYVIKVLATANSTGLDELGRAGTGLDLYFGGEISVLDYDETSSLETGVVTTKDPTTLTDLSGAVLSGTPTLIESRFQNTGGLNTNQLMIHRYQPTNSPSNSITEVEAVISLDGADLVGKTTIQSSAFEGSAQNFTARFYDPFQIFKVEIQTNWNTAVDGAWNPAFGGTASLTWKFGANEVVGNNPNYSGTYLDGTTKTVIVTADYFALITSAYFESYKIVGVLDFSLFNFSGSFSVRSNPNLTGVTHSSSNMITAYEAQNCNITGVLDVSGVNISTSFAVTNNPSLTEITHSLTNTCSQYFVDSCGLIGTLNVTNVNLTGTFTANTNPLLTGINHSLSNTISLYSSFDCDLTGTLDLSNVQLNGDINLRRNSSLTDITHSVTNSVTNYEVAGCDLLVLNLTTVNIVSLFAVDANPNLTTINHSAGTLITFYFAENCDIQSISGNITMDSISSSFTVRNNGFNQAQADAFFALIDTNTLATGLSNTIDFRDNIDPTGGALNANIISLAGKGVTTLL